jgi:hypothetical protein
MLPLFFAAITILKKNPDLIAEAENELGGNCWRIQNL